MSSIVYSFHRNKQEVFKNPLNGILKKQINFALFFSVMTSQGMNPYDFITPVPHLITCQVREILQFIRCLFPCFVISYQLFDHVFVFYDLSDCPEKVSDGTNVNSSKVKEVSLF